MPKLTKKDKRIHQIAFAFKNIAPAIGRAPHFDMAVGKDFMIIHFGKEPHRFIKYVKDRLKDV